MSSKIKSLAEGSKKIHCADENTWFWHQKDLLCSFVASKTVLSRILLTVKPSHQDKILAGNVHIIRLKGYVLYLKFQKMCHIMVRLHFYDLTCI